MVVVTGSEVWLLRCDCGEHHHSWNCGGCIVIIGGSIAVEMHTMPAALTASPVEMYIMQAVLTASPVEMYSMPAAYVHHVGCSDSIRCGNAGR